VNSGFRGAVALFALVAGGSLLGAGGVDHRRVQADAWPWDLPPGFPAPRVPAHNPMSEAKVELGRLLFFDTRLSGNGTQSCATCHRPELAFTDGRARAIGSTGESHPRSTMSLVNVAYNASFTWQDPTLTSLESQARVPMFNTHPTELGLAGREDELLKRLADDVAYTALFARAFPREAKPVSVENVVRAIASFERTLVAGRAPYFRLVYGDETDALSTSAKRGMALFFSDRLKCSTCHVGFTFSGPIRAVGLGRIEPAFHNTGLYSEDALGNYPEPNRGAIAVTGRAEHRGAFRAPTLLNITLTAPYMHDGSIATLPEVLEFYAAGGRGAGRSNPNKSERVSGFTLTDAEKRDLLAFLESLTDREFVDASRLADPTAGGRGAMLNP
jgi:cytochrome c peroxidase